MNVYQNTCRIETMYNPGRIVKINWPLLEALVTYLDGHLATSQLFRYKNIIKYVQYMIPSP
jgi:hypothetical protein